MEYPRNRMPASESIWDVSHNMAVMPRMPPVAEQEGHCDKMSHIDMGDDRISDVISHVNSPFSMSVSNMTISISHIDLPCRYRIIS